MPNKTITLIPIDNATLTQAMQYADFLGFEKVSFNNELHTVIENSCDDFDEQNPWYADEHTYCDVCASWYSDDDTCAYH